MPSKIALHIANAVLARVEPTFGAFTKRDEEVAEIIDILSGPLTSAAFASVADEMNRVRSVEGFDAAHDDKHDAGEIARAAACYALPVHVRKFPTGKFETYRTQIWPWEEKWWKPSPDNRRRELVKAAGLIISEIERLDRAEQLRTKRTRSNEDSFLSR